MINAGERNDLQNKIINSIGIPHGRLILAPRIGKTRIIIEIIKKFKPSSVLYVTPSTVLKDVDIPNEFEKWGGADIYNERVKTITYSSLYKEKGYYEFIVFDEEQYLTENNSQGLFDNTLTYSHIISMTGTPAKTEIKVDIINALKLPVLYDITIDRAVRYDILSDYMIQVVYADICHDREMLWLKSNGKTLFKESEKNIYDRLTKSIENIRNTGNTLAFNNATRKRMHFIHNSRTKLYVTKYIVDKIEGRTLIFSPTISTSKFLCPYVFNSKTDNRFLDAFNNGDISKLSLVNSGGVGFTFPDVQNIIIMQCNSNNTGNISQKIARCLQKEEDKTANIWIVCLLDTQDEKWTNKALADFNSDKIKKYRISPAKYITDAFLYPPLLKKQTKQYLYETI